LLGADHACGKWLTQGVRTCSNRTRHALRI
jgi:hypothetical protein